MVVTPRQKDELKEWTKYLSECEDMVARSNNEMEIEINQAMAHYASNKILQLEKEMYTTP